MTNAQQRVGLAGGYGYGEAHRHNLARLHAAGRAELVGVADPAGPPADPPGNGQSTQGPAWYPALQDLLTEQACDVVIIATPTHTHADLAELAMRSGAAVYLEKPPAASWALFEHLLAVSRETDRPCQVGFQALGSHALQRIDDLTGIHAVGDPQVVAAQATWCRTRSYFDRAVWSGRRWLDSRPVADGVATNALAHAVTQALRIAGITAVHDISTITTELYAANRDNEADDTTWIKVEAPGRPPVSCALTLCGPGGNLPPRVDVIGDRGRLDLEYTRDRLLIDTGADEPSIENHGRIDLLENLLAHDVGEAELISPLSSAAPYMAVLQAIQDADPKPLTNDVRIDGEGQDAHPVIGDIEYWIDRAATSGLGFAGSGAPWADDSAVRVRRRESAQNPDPER